MTAHAIKPGAPPRVRFAPSPTGALHLGGARTALFNWLFARRYSGKFILRIEDTDLERSREDVIEQVLDALRWLGLEWDEGPGVGGPCGPYFQSQRRELHLERARKLVAEGKAYDCYMSPEELEAHRQVAIAAGRPFHYEGWHRELSQEKIAAFRAEGRRPAIRLRVDAPASGFTVNDLIKGPTHFPPDQIDDFVLVRSDGTPSFHLANVVDDATMGITHAIRGEDHLTNAAKHLFLFDALGEPAPQYGHLPMILGADRSKLSKRHGAVSVTDYRAMGYLPDALVNELALLGWSAEDGRERLTRAELVERFDLARVGRSGAIFDFAKLDHFNGLLIREMPDEELGAALAPFEGELAALPQEQKRALLALLKDSIVKLADYPAKAREILDAPALADELLAEPAMGGAAAVLAHVRAAFAAPSLAWESEPLKAALKQAGKDLGKKGKELFFPLRAALMGSFHGPALDGVMLILGREACLARIAAAQAWLAAKGK